MTMIPIVILRPIVFFTLCVFLLFGCATQPLQPLSATSAEQRDYAIPAENPKYGVDRTPGLQVVELLLFGGRDHNVFLGCLNCTKHSSGSIWNKYGDYGSRYSDTSIWNRYGAYGSKYSDESPWNRYGQTPPAIVDRDGNFYGYFTANKYLFNRTRIEWLLQILDNYETVIENFDNFVDELK